MRISDWSSDVCSSDLLPRLLLAPLVTEQRRHLVAEGQQARGLQAHHRHATRDGRADDGQAAPHLGLGLLDQAGGEEGSPAAQRPAPLRSEEHTSELQSLMRISYAVFCLKTKKNQTSTHTNTTLKRRAYTCTQ